MQPLQCENYVCVPPDAHNWTHNRTKIASKNKAPKKTPQIGGCLGPNASKSEKVSKKTPPINWNKPVFGVPFLDSPISSVRKALQARHRPFPGVVLEPFWAPFDPLACFFGRSVMQKNRGSCPSTHTHNPTTASHLS